MGRIKNKAQFFTIDALVALTIIIITIMVISPTLKQPQQNSHTSADILQAIGSLKIQDFDNTYAKQLLAEGKISDPTKSVIDQIGEFYVTDIIIAKALAEEVLAPISPNENIGIWFGTTLLASKNITSFESAQNIFTERQTISGIGGGSGVTGFSARAFLSSGARTDYLYFGGYVGEGNITSQINYQGNITSAQIELTINNDFEIFINNINVGNFSKSPDEFTPVPYLIDITKFTSGTNTLQVKGESLHITGGFIKIIYNSEVTYEQPDRYNFPGIEGIINLYDGFYIPGNLTGLKISLHLNSSINTFLMLGNTLVFNSSSDGTSPITITNDTLNTLLDYSNLSKKTIPLRLGIENMDYVSGNSNEIDVFSVTSISGQMQGGSKIDLLKTGNYEFVKLMLTNINSKVGLVAYKTAATDENYHPLSRDAVSLNNSISTWKAGGSTCTCCGINRAVENLVENSNSSRFRSIVIMSAGVANTKCLEQGTGDPEDDAIKAVCDAYNNYGIRTYTIGFGPDANVETLTTMAACADGSFFSTIDDLEEIYKKIAEELIETAYIEQTIEVTGDFFSQLYPDSYIEFEYTKEPAPIGLVTTIEQPFQSPGVVTFILPTNSTLLEANVISYSGPKWTTNVNINNLNAYNLSAYQTDFLKLGDPYSINIPPQLIQANNTLELEVGLSPFNLSAGSINNKVVYTISKELSSYTSISATSNGCNWLIQFDDYNLTMQIPTNYTGTQNCKYTSLERYCDIYSNCEGATDATQIATHNLFKLLDFNLDGILDVQLSEDNLQITTSNLEGVPFLFSTEVQIRKWY